MVGVLPPIVVKLDVPIYAEPLAIMLFALAVAPMLIDEGVIAPSVKVIAGVVVDVATVPDTPLAVVTETLVTVPEPEGVPHVPSPRRKVVELGVPVMPPKLLVPILVSVLLEAEMVLFVKVCVAAIAASVSVAAGNVRVKFDAPEFAEVKVVAPVDEPKRRISLLLKVFAAVKVWAVPSTATVSVAAGNVTM